MKNRQALHTLLEKYNDLFQGQLSEWPKMEVTVELTKDAVPFHLWKTDLNPAHLL